MKKTIFTIILLLTAAFHALAEQHGVFMEYHRKSKPGSQTQVNRAPMRLFIDVIYDTEERRVLISSEEFFDADVYLLNPNGQIEDYSSILNCEFDITTGLHIIRIEGDGWYAEGTIDC